ncbi:MAG: ABC transporter ATP-binding protein [Thermodesulfobacteriota bacterium]|nr:ABC transporter ATP-binding protein [Thermodesulfobacteriota bacterium]
MTRNDDMLLSIQDLKVYFRGNHKVARAVDGISLEVGQGETVCLVGESGCGKTVSALTTMGLIASPPGDIVGGKVRFNGQDLLGLSEEEMQGVRGRRIAMVFQEPMTSLNPVFTIGDQIAEAITVHEEAKAEQVKERSVRLLTDVGMADPEERLKDYPHQLSGGQRQRVMIAMALACNPKLVIADEPTTALDVTVQAQILDLFGELQKKRNMAVFYITHDLGVVRKIADRVYVMYAGIIVEQGLASDIFYTPCHPYTQGLLSSLPDRRKRGTKLKSIPGTVPDPAFKPEGCPFHPRCEQAVANCTQALPEMCQWGGKHLSRCPVVYKQRSHRTKARGRPS